MTGATTEPTRLLSLDAIRGIAVMGILAMNIVGFAMPNAAYLNPMAWGTEGPLDLAVWAVNFVLVDGKMRGLFSVLFGASMLLVIQSAEARGASGAGLHYARMFWLMLFGLAHYYLIWFGDILFLYAVIGMIAFLFRNRSPKVLLWSAIGFLVFNLLFMGGFALTLPMMPPAEAAKIVGAPGTANIVREFTVYSGDYAGILAFKTEPARVFMPLAGLGLFGAETLGFMLLGMALLKTGFLTGEWEDARYRRVLVPAYAIGIPAMIALAAWVWSTQFDPITVFAVTVAWAAPFRVLLIVAHAALAMILIRRFRETAIVGRIAAAGRAAFTNYLGTSLVMTTIFYGYGLGLFGEVPRAALYLFVLGMWALMLLWSKPWLERFQYGPLEWLWRSLSRGRLQRLTPANA